VGSATASTKAVVFKNYNQLITSALHRTNVRATDIMGDHTLIAWREASYSIRTQTTVNNLQNMLHVALSNGGLKLDYNVSASKRITAHQQKNAEESKDAHSRVTDKI
jgi:Asp-tRNA(Asn)/Glu-tRNA(Gln) amidotransferase B subunit